MSSTPLNTLRAGLLALGAIIILLAPVTPALAQMKIEFERERGRQILDVIKNDIRKNYYDATFRGINLDSHFKAAEARVAKAASIGEILSIVAQAVMDFGDSHTYFVPPRPSDRLDYGLELQIVGDKCYVSAVKPGSDAQARGLKPGDLVHSMEGRTPKRDMAWYMFYNYYRISAAASARLVVQSPGGQARVVSVQARVTPGQKVHNLGTMTGNDRANLIREDEIRSRLSAHRYMDIKEQDLFLWKMPAFDLAPEQVGDLMEKILKRKSLILDLRGNGGGRVDTLQRLVGHFFDREIKIGDVKGRKETKPLVAKSQGKKAFKGDLVVLIDSESGSSAEIFARVIQVEKRGKVLGDRSMGAVMQAQSETYKSGVDFIFYYGVVVTTADLIMTDGNSLEGKGVRPDELILPSAEDMAAGRDMALARALDLVGLKVEPEKAGELFPVEWRK